MGDSSWQPINRGRVGWAEKNGLERGRKIRVEATAVESDIRYPTDSPLRCDAIRVVMRLLKRLSQRQLVSWVDHSRRAQRRCLNIRNSRGKKREQPYRDLLKGACKTRGYAHRTCGQVPSGPIPSAKLWPKSWPTIWS